MCGEADNAASLAGIRLTMMNLTGTDSGGATEGIEVPASSSNAQIGQSKLADPLDLWTGTLGAADPDGLVTADFAAPGRKASR